MKSLTGTGSYQKRIEKLIAEQAAEIYINWINIGEAEALRGGADICTELLLAAGYRPDGSGAAEAIRSLYENGLKDAHGHYIRLPQETWRK